MWTSGDGNWAAFPGLAPDSAVTPGRRLECDGELFEVRGDGRRGTHYTWLTGPNPGYGFSVSPTDDHDDEQHRGNIRDFLAMVDPGTGFIEDD